MDNELLEEIREAIREEIRDSIDLAVETAFESVDLNERINEAVKNAFCEMQFVLPEGTTIKTKEKLKVLSPDKRKFLTCYGGLRINDYNRDGKIEGFYLTVQTHLNAWEYLALYSTEEEAKKDLLLVKAAMENGTKILEL